MKAYLTGLSIFLFSLTAPLSAAVCNWIGGDGNWNNAANWSCGMVPGSGDRVTILTDNVDITVDIEVMVDTLFLDGSNTRLIGSHSITVLKYMTWQFGIIEVNIATQDILIEEDVFKSKFLHDTLTINNHCQYNFTNWLWIEEGGVLINNGNLHSDNSFQINSLGPAGAFINYGTFTKDSIGGTASWIPITNYGTMNILTGNFSRNREFINHGTLRIDESMTGTLTTEFQNHGVLSGHGLIVLPTNYDLADGIIAPGSSPGQLSFRNSSSVVSLSGELQIELANNSGPGIGHDHINVVSPHVVLGGTLTVTATGSIPDGIYTIVEAIESCSGSFDTINLPLGYAIYQTETKFQLIKGNCISDLDLDDAYLAGDPHQSDFHALQVLRAQGVVTIGENLQFRAGSEMELLPEFTVEAGAVLDMQIEGCPE